ncbi:MAG: signal peptide peptidase SppA [Chlorobi bacterium]|nr:signal peptide peptidase SppA [Chlorobiota bacterium]
MSNPNTSTPPPYYRPTPKKSGWWIPVAVILAIVVGFVVVVIALISSVASSFETEPYEVTQNTVLKLDYGTSLDEYTGSDLGAIFGNPGSKASFYDVLKAVKRAADDDKIEGIYIKASHTSMGYAKAAEIRDALIEFKKSGKFVYAFIEVGTETDYYNALPADKIFMSSEGIMELDGFNISAMFMKGMFAKFGIEFNVQGFEDFKSAGDSYSRKNFSDSSRHQLKVLIDHRYKNFVGAIAESRSMDKEKVLSALNRGIYTADTIQALGFVDELATETQVKRIIKEEVFGEDFEDMKLKFVSIRKYVDGVGTLSVKKTDRNTKIAIINAVGAIKSGSKTSPFDDEKSIASGEIVKHLKSACKDDKVKAIILRIDSPGGSVIASEEMWDEIVRTKKVKPVYASMSDVAASGGYYMAMACDTIVAHPNTITGSIGVISIIPNFSKLLEKLDITVDTISTAANANFLNPMLAMQAKDKKKFYDLSKGIYFRFLNKVAESRNKTFEETRALAKGRVWVGDDAFDRGLVDVQGGLGTTIQLVKNRLGIPDSLEPRFRMYPRKPDEMEAIMELFGLGDEQDEAAVSSAVRIAELINADASAFTKIYNKLPQSAKKQFAYFADLMEISEKEHAAMALPYYFDIE